MAERVGFEPTCRFYPTIRFRVGAVMTASVPLRGKAVILPQHMMTPVLHHPRNRGRATLALGLRRLALGASCALLLASCAQAPHLSALEQVRARGKLRVVTLSSPTSYYLGTHGPQGFEYRLASAFAERLGVKLEVEAVLDAAAMRAALAQDRADLAAAQITPDLAWRRIGLLSHS